jgi:hypothetical protein
MSSSRSSSSIGSSTNTSQKDPYQTILELQFKAKIYSILKNTQDLTEEERNSILKTSEVFSAFEILNNRAQCLGYKASQIKCKLSSKERAEAESYSKVTNILIMYFLGQCKLQKNNLDSLQNLSHNSKKRSNHPRSINLEKGLEMLMQSFEICNSAIEKIRYEKNKKAKAETEAKIKANAVLGTTGEKSTKKDVKAS